MLVSSPANALAVNADNRFLLDCDELSHPFLIILFHDNRNHDSKDSIKRVVRGNPCGKLQILPKKRLMSYSVILDFIPRVAICHSCGYGNE